jgi:hypothetical protein
MHHPRGEGRRGRGLPQNKKGRESLYGLQQLGSAGQLGYVRAGMAVQWLGPEANSQLVWPSANADVSSPCLVPPLAPRPCGAYLVFLLCINAIGCVKRARAKGVVGQEMFKNLTNTTSPPLADLSCGGYAS